MFYAPNWKEIFKYNNNEKDDSGPNGPSSTCWLQYRERS